MVDRIGRLGDQSGDKESTFKHLMIPSATNDWDIGRLEKRKQLSRKLLGRLTAYTKMFDLATAKEPVSFTFLDWLKQACDDSGEISKKPCGKPKKGKLAHKGDEHISFCNVNALMDEVAGSSLPGLSESLDKVEGFESDMTRLLRYQQKSSAVKQLSLIHI